MGVAIQPDGKILAVGVATNDLAGTSTRGALVRYNPDGSLDASFGSGGKVDYIHTDTYAVKVQPDGKILAAGISNDWYQDVFALVRFNSDGSLDSSFGYSRGLAMGGPGHAYSIAIQPDGAIIIAGVSVSGFNSNFGLMRFDSTGYADATFGVPGEVATDFFGNRDVAMAVALQPDGKILAARFAEGSSGSETSDFALARYDANGSLDVTFGSGGKVTTDFSGGEDQAFSIALTPNGGALLAGCAHTGSSEDVAPSCYSLGTIEEIPDFRLEFDQLVVHAAIAEKVKIAVNIRRSGGFVDKVVVTPPDLWAEGIITQSPGPIKTKGTTAAWTFKIKGRAAPGAHALTFVARDTTGKQRSATATLLVE